MSKWTHVTGIIRFDSLSKNYDWMYKLRNRFILKIPKGSDGSLQVDVKELDTDADSIVWAYVAINGDLRDYDNIGEIFEWIQKSCRGYLVRQCSVDIKTETMSYSISQDTAYTHLTVAVRKI
jgi:hypothetical protein